MTELDLENPASEIETPAPSEGVDETATDAPEAAADTEQPAEEKKEPSEADKVKAAMQKRIDRLTAQRSEAERKLQENEQRLAALAPKQTDDGPKEADFETYEEFLIAKGEHKARKDYEAKEAEAKKAERTRLEQQQFEAQRKEFDAKEAEFRKTTPDYDDTVAVLNEAIGSVNHKSPEFQAFREMLLSSSDLPALSYELGKNPEILDELQTMRPGQIARKLFEIEQGIKNKPAPTTKDVLPTPIKPLGGKVRTEKPLEQMSPKQIEAWRKAK